MHGTRPSARGLRAVGAELGLIVVAAVLFALSFPNDINARGFGVLGFVALFPLMRLVWRAPFWRLCVYAPFIGFATYALFNIWLVNFHPLAIFIVPIIYAGFFLLLIPALKLPCLCLGRLAWLAQLFIWLGFEYLRTTGFLSYAYGIVGYTQYLNVPMLNVASLTGVWGVSALVLMPQFFLAQRLGGWGLFTGLSTAVRAVRGAEGSGFAGAAREIVVRIREACFAFGRVYSPELVCIVVLFAASLGYGILSQVDYSEAPTVEMILVQQNVDPWIGGTRAYRNSMEASIRQTQRALAEAPDADLVVWSETSFVPAIDYHSRYRRSPERFELVQELLSYIESTGKPVLLGNGDAQLEPNAEGELVRKNYNAVYLYSGEEERQIYRKQHLVPFTESFPYREQLPWLYRILEERDTSFWEHGDEWTVFELENLSNVDSLRFSTPICFEDTFGYISRGFVQRSAELIINLTNDSWSKSVPAATQHAAMAVFRSVENRRSVVRSTNGGLTLVIDPNGRIIAENEPFTESYIVADVPVFTQVDPPALFLGDIFAYIFTALGVLCLLVALVMSCAKLWRSRKIALQKPQKDM